MTAEIISVGTELLLGNILNTNAQYLSRELADLGITVQRESRFLQNASGERGRNCIISPFIMRKFCVDFC